MSVFNPTQFENVEYSDANDTTIIPVPEGDFPGVAKKYEFRALKDGKVVVDVTWSINDPEVTQATGRDENTVRQGVFLDLTESGTLDMGTGKNVALGRLRDALGQNKPGKPWRWGDLVGGVAMLKITHRVVDETGDIFAEVKKVSKLD